MRATGADASVRPTDLWRGAGGDGWEDAEVHNDPKEVREKALKMGTNILNYIFKN
jgi:hypothetical protein